VGESWADVLPRPRALLREVRQDHRDERVVLFGHEATVLLVRRTSMRNPDEQVITCSSLLRD
jgi:probable phosphoglycerate mutase